MFTFVFVSRHPVISLFSYFVVVVVVVNYFGFGFTAGLFH